MPFQVLLGTSQWDAVRFCRAMTEDLYTPFIVPDESYMSYHEEVSEDFSRWVPLDYQVGNVMTSTSPFQTVVNQQRYVCNSANGFTVAPMQITDVLYRAAGSLSAVNELAFLALLPLSPLNRFLSTPYILDSPSERILRDQVLSEAGHYGQGYWGLVRDPATGLPAIDLYPIPAAAGTPIFVRYAARHTNTASEVLADATYPTVPEDKKRQFARLLYCMILEQEQERFAKATSTRAGILQGSASPALLDRKIERIRTETYQQLGGTAPSVLHIL
jgi:hypothetical protein